MEDECRVSGSDEECIGAVILAAGASTRMGTPKQLLEYRGETLLRRAAHAALKAGCSPVVVVMGAHAELLREELRGLDVLEAKNPHWASGMGSSVRVGVEAVVEADAGVAAVVLMLCDQPFVTSEVVAGLVATYRKSARPIVASQYGGSFGVPALFSKSFLEELARLEDGAGAKQIIQRHLPQVHLLPFPGGETDVDTPEDFARLLSPNER